jgi:N-succinyldiaminopimelate aminotransferase
MNSNIEKLHPYPFEKLAQLKAGITPPAHLNPISLSIGEPTHNAPEFVKRRFSDSLNELNRYPTTRGIKELRETIALWLEKRFSLKKQSLDVDSNILPVCGTREALFAFVQSTIANETQSEQPLLVLPNPFYQIYEGAAILAGADVNYINCTETDGFLPDFSLVPKQVWQRCQLLQLCTPGNPTGAVLSLTHMQQAIELADKYDFIIASDECYSEVYLDESSPPPGLLEACSDMGRHDYSRCVVFHSLSKRSNLPGLRSGFVAGDHRLIQSFYKYRTYHGSTMSLPAQKASLLAWSDEQHTRENRALYREKFSAVISIFEGVLSFSEPVASFYLWVKTPIDDIDFSQRLFAEQNITVVPGQYLSRDSNGCNPGANHIRIALVASTEECIDAATRIREFVESLPEGDITNA